MGATGASRRQFELIAERLGPHIQSGTLKRWRLTQVASAVGADADVMQRLEDALQAAGIRVIDDLAAGKPTAAAASPPVAHVSPPPPTPDASNAAETAQAAARRRIAMDRLTARPERILLSAQEEVGLTLILRGPEGKPLVQGGLKNLVGERREAAHALVLHNLRLVHSIAQRFRASGMDYLDVYQGGLPGLMRAVELFDPLAGNKFSTYATHWIQQSMQRTVANESRLIRLPVHMFERLQKVWATRERMTADGQPPSLTALASECGLTRDQVLECVKLGPGPVSLDTPVGDLGSTTLGDLVDREAEHPEHVEVKGILPDDVLPWLDELSQREADVIRMRFGLAPYAEPMILEDIGKCYRVTRERIRQIEAKALAKLRLRPTELVPEALPTDEQQVKSRDMPSLTEPST